MRALAPAVAAALLLTACQPAPKAKTLQENLQVKSIGISQTNVLESPWRPVLVQSQNQIASHQLSPTPAMILLNDEAGQPVFLGPVYGEFLVQAILDEWEAQKRPPINVGLEPYPLQADQDQAPPPGQVRLLIHQEKETTVSGTVQIRLKGKDQTLRWMLILKVIEEDGRFYSDQTTRELHLTEPLDSTLELGQIPPRTAQQSKSLASQPLTADLVQILGGEPPEIPAITLETISQPFQDTSDTGGQTSTQGQTSPNTKAPR